MACDFQGSHWESRILAHEIMATNVGYYSKIGPLTLAAFEDSGWYGIAGSGGGGVGGLGILTGLV
jgi:hypothetical protein